MGIEEGKDFQGPSKKDPLEKDLSEKDFQGPSKKDPLEKDLSEKDFPGPSKKDPLEKDLSEKDFEKGPSKNDLLEKYEDIVLGPFNYVKSLPSKNIRRTVTEMMNYWTGLPQIQVDAIMKVASDLHNASLIIDDIEDGSDLRRGSPATHIKHGVPQSINSANYAYFKAMEDMMEIFPPERVPKVIRLLVRGMMDLHIGQGVEMFWRDENNKAEKGSFFHIPTEQEYYDVIIKKTSRQFSMLAEFSAEVTKTESGKQLFYIADLIGTHFQIRDDLLNLISGSYEEGKGFCEDISEGKFSFPIIHALTLRGKPGGISEAKASRLLEILRMQTQDKDLKKEALNIITEAGAITYCKKKVREFKVKIGREVLRLGGNPIFVKNKHVFADHF